MPDFLPWGETYTMPQDGEYDSYISFIDALPLVVEPSVFGFNENANITKDQAATTQLLGSILETEKGSGSGGGDDSADGDDDGGSGGGEEKSEDDIIFEVAGSSLAKMPALFDMEFANLRYPVRWDNSMNVVLCQELERFNNLNKVICSSLKDVQDATKGIIVQSEQIEACGKSLFFGRVPEAWESSSYPSLKPLASYISDLLQRLSFLKDWLEKDPPPTFWISGFFFTQAFLTGQLQNFARKYTIPIDDVVFDFVVMDGSKDDYDTAPDDGAYVWGLFIDGARWDSDKRFLADSLPKILFSPAPVILLKPAKTSDLETFPHYNAPVYKTSERRGVLSTTGHSTNFVMWMRLPSDRPEEVWIEAGVALLTCLDD